MEGNTKLKTGNHFPKAGSEHDSEKQEILARIYKNLTLVDLQNLEASLIGNTIGSINVRYNKDIL